MNKVIGLINAWSCETFIEPAMLQAIEYCDEVIVSVGFHSEEVKKFEDNTYDIQLALAGFTKTDVSVKYADNELTISSNHEKWDDDKKQSLVHQGISKRKFTRTFTLADDIEINEAELKDGLLTVSLEKIIPDNKKPRTIKIQ